MDLTIIFGHIWGPVLVLLGIGIFTSPAYYRGVYGGLAKEPFAAFVFGLFASAFGVAQVTLHNLWGTAEEVIVTLLSWGMLFKGAAFLIAPDFVAAAGKHLSGKQTVAAVGVALIALGGYLSFVSYF